eukprot:15473727-Alexandrium_andersonii.AAC.1
MCALRRAAAIAVQARMRGWLARAGVPLSRSRAVAAGWGIPVARVDGVPGGVGPGPPGSPQHGM